VKLQSITITWGYKLFAWFSLKATWFALITVILVNLNEKIKTPSPLVEKNVLFYWLIWQGGGGGTGLISLFIAS